MRAYFSRAIFSLLMLCAWTPAAVAGELVLDLFSKDDARYIFQLAPSVWEQRVLEVTATQPQARAFEDSATGGLGLAFLPIDDVVMSIVPFYQSGGRGGRPTSIKLALAFDGEVGRQMAERELEGILDGMVEVFRPEFRIAGQVERQMGLLGLIMTIAEAR